MDISPPSSPLRLDISPPSSPVPESPPKKQRTWKVYSGAVDSGEHSKSTNWRWRKKGVDCADSQHSACQHPNEQDQLPSPTSPSQSFHSNQEDFVGEEERESSNNFLRIEDSGDEDGQSTTASSVSENDCDLISSASSNSLIHTDSEQSESVVESDISDVDSEVSFESESEEEFLPVYSGCKYSVDEAVLDILTDHINNRGTRQSLSDHLRTVLKYLPKYNSMPKTLKTLLSYVEKLVPAYKVAAHSYCEDCLYLKENETDPCASCDGHKNKYFYNISLIEQIKYYLENSDLASVIDSYGQNHLSDGKIRDIVDGSEYVRVRVHGQYNLTLMMNTDGVAISRSSKSKIWPVMYTICEVPPFLRQRFLIVCGIWCDIVDPPMNTYLEPFVIEVQDAYQNGITWTHPETKQVITSKIVVPCICADAPARACIQNILHHMGRRGCNSCEMKTVLIPLTERERLEKERGAKVRRKRAYVMQEEGGRPRTDQRMREQALQAHQSKQIVRGVKGPTVVSCLPKLDVSKCVFAEYMHGVCLGNVKTFLKLWITVPGPWSLSDKKDEIDNYLNSIAPTSDICRLPRGVNQLKYWKASEFRSWLLFYSLPCLSGKLPEEYLQHWSLLVLSIFLLLQEEISEVDLERSETMIRIFVRDIGRLYRLSDYTYNAHQLLHLTSYVKWWGPLWSNSAFIFESYNGNLTNLIHGTKNRAVELLKNVKIAHGVEILRNKVHSKKHFEVLDTIEPLNKCKSNVTLPEDKDLLASYGFPMPSQKDVFLRVRRGKEVLTSKSYVRQKKRNNYTIKFQNETVRGFGEVHYYFSVNESVYAVVDKFRVKHNETFSHVPSGSRLTHLICVEPSHDRLVINIKDILFRVIKVGQFVTISPNKLERNL